MRLFICLVLLGFLWCVSCKNVNFGNKTSSCKRRDKVFCEAIPWKKRVYYYEYTGPDDLIIKAVYCYDYQNSEASVNLTEGGPGYNYVSLRMKSQRSYRLDYTIEIYD
ncbi:unnamed protein product [Diatraea saccharalis]|uniref:Uncharacterized protein n=1 Tax=Diatraea saccharalis TaxID=40085 RepID=A0A9N9QYM4_9NEOP|nr:unnamed protein product [Diatraea saccharalis]